jgi:uncharacterized protein YkwD
MKRVIKLNKTSIIGIGGLLAVILCLSLFTDFGSKSLNYLSAIYASVLETLANSDRASANLANLSVNPLLAAAAQMKADDMASRSYFSHNTPEGLSPWYWFSKAGYNYKYAGENLAVNFVDSEEVEHAWMDSPLHRLNILNPNFTEIGIATSTGIYEGRSAIFVVQMFGTPLSP